MAKVGSLLPGQSKALVNTLEVILSLYHNDAATRQDNPTACHSLRSQTSLLDENVHQYPGAKMIK